MTLILQKELEPITKQIRRIVGIYGEEIKQIILVGGSAQMPKIVDYFSSNFNLKTSLGKSKLMKKPLLYNVAIGLALNKYKEGINILPDIRTKVSRFNKRRVWRIFIIVVTSLILGILLTLLVFHYWKVRQIVIIK